MPKKVTNQGYGTNKAWTQCGRSSFGVLILMAMPDSNSEFLTCQEVRDLMFLIATNELEDEVAEKAFLHMAHCPDCREALAEHVKIAAALIGTMGKGKDMTA